MNVKDSKGRVRSFPGPDDLQRRGQEQRDVADYFEWKYPSRPSPDLERAIYERLAQHSPAWRALHFQERPDHAAIFARFEAGTL